MSIQLPSYLLRSRHAVFYFRILPPKDILAAVGQTEIRLSLKTCEQAKAISIAIFLRVWFAGWFDTIRHMDTPKIELWKTEGRFHCYKLIREVPTENGRRFTTDLFRVPVDEGLSAWTLRLSNGRAMEGLPDNMTEEQQAAILQAAGMLDPQTPPQAQQPELAIGTPIVPLSKLIEKYAAERMKGNVWSEKTRQENVSRLTIACCYLNDPDLRQIAALHVTRMKEAFSFLPTHVASEGLTHHGLLALIESHKQPPSKNTKSTEKTPRTISVPTLNKLLNRFDSFCEWCVAQGYNATNPAANKTIRVSVDEDDLEASRVAYSHANLKTIFESPFYNEQMYEHSYQYWVPHLALFTGARINELSQLAVDDIYKHADGIWVIRIKGVRSRNVDKNDSGQRSKQTVKTMSSRRIIPVHPKLIEVGLLDFIEQRQKEKHTLLFPEITPGRDGFGQRVSRWYNETHMPDNLGFPKGNGLVFHSFRHTIANDLKQRLMTNPKYSHLYNKDLLVKAILGHKIDDITFESYSGPFRPEVTQIVVNELDWCLSLTKYQPPKPDAHKRLLQWRRRDRNGEDGSTIDFELPTF